MLEFQSGDTPLHYASEKGHLPVVQFLIESGADVNVVSKVRNYCNRAHVVKIHLLVFLFLIIL